MQELDRLFNRWAVTRKVCKEVFGWVLGQIGEGLLRQVAHGGLTHTLSNRIDWRQRLFQLWFAFANGIFRVCKLGRTPHETRLPKECNGIADFKLKRLSPTEVKET